MKKTFELTYEFLMFLSKITGFSYKEINIIIWFILIPSSWSFLIDKIRGKPYFKIGCLIIALLGLVFIKDFSRFSKTLFDNSADFLKSFSPIGMDYTRASIIICLLLPLIVYAILLNRAFFNKKK